MLLCLRKSCHCPLCIWRGMHAEADSLTAHSALRLCAWSHGVWTAYARSLGPLLCAVGACIFKEGIRGDGHDDGMAWASWYLDFGRSSLRLDLCTHRRGACVHSSLHHQLLVQSLPPPRLFMCDAGRAIMALRHRQTLCDAPSAPHLISTQITCIGPISSPLRAGPTRSSPPGSDSRSG